MRNIREEDLALIMQWRMSTDVTRYMNTNPKLTLEGQKKWLASISEREDVQYWLIEQDGVPVGVINLADIDYEKKSTSWGYYIGEKRYRSLQLAISLEMSLYDYVFDVLELEELHNEVFSLNAGVVKLHLACGSHIVCEVEDEVEKEGVKYDITHISIDKKRWNEIRLNKKYEHIDFDMNIRPHHIGYAVADLQMSIDMYRRMGWYQSTQTYEDNGMKVKIAFMVNKLDGSCIELIAPLGDSGPVSDILLHNKNVSLPYHICYETDDMERSLSVLKRRGFMMVKNLSPAVAFDNRMVAFLLNKSVGMIELVEKG